MGSVAGAIGFLCVVIAAVVAFRRCLKRRKKATSDDASSFITPNRWSRYTYTEKTQDDGPSELYPTLPGVSGDFDHQEVDSGSGSGRYSNFDARVSVGSGQALWPSRLEPVRLRESVTQSQSDDSIIRGDDSESLAGIPDPPPAYIP